MLPLLSITQTCVDPTADCSPVWAQLQSISCYSINPDCCRTKTWHYRCAGDPEEGIRYIVHKYVIENEACYTFSGGNKDCAPWV